MNDVEFKTLRADAELYYKSINDIWCPALKSNVNFNSSGFHHLRFDNTRAERSKSEQRNKLMNIKNAVEIIKSSNTIQQYRKCLQTFGKVGKDGFSKTCWVFYYAFISITNIEKMIRFKVIVRKVGDGPFHFWSVMPYWQKNKLSENHIIHYIGSDKLQNE